MMKQEIIDELNKRGVTFDPNAKKDELAALLAPPAGASENAAPEEQPAPPDAPAGDIPPAAPDAADPAPDSDAGQRLSGENEGARTTSASLHFALPAEEVLPESEILAKTKAGLSREQAVEVINAQRAHDGLEPLAAAELIEAGAEAEDIDPAELAAKMKAGLGRDQAIEVIRAQSAHDEAIGG